MANKQHIYEGEGNPFDLGIHAPVGSHYIDTTRTDLVWMSTFHDPNPDEPYTEWVKLEEQWPPTVSPGGGWGLQLPFTGRASAVMRDGGHISFSGEGVIFSNVEMTTNLDGRTYSSPDAFMFTAVGTDDGSAIFTVSPLFEYIQGGAES